MTNIIDFPTNEKETWLDFYKKACQLEITDFPISNHYFKKAIELLAIRIVRIRRANTFLIKQNEHYECLFKELHRVDTYIPTHLANEVLINELCDDDDDVAQLVYWVRFICKTRRVRDLPSTRVLKRVLNMTNSDPWEELEACKDHGAVRIYTSKIIERHIKGGL